MPQSHNLHIIYFDSKLFLSAQGSPKHLKASQPQHRSSYEYKNMVPTHAKCYFKQLGNGGKCVSSPSPWTGVNCSMSKWILSHPPFSFYDLLKSIIIIHTEPSMCTVFLTEWKYRSLSKGPYNLDIETKMTTDEREKRVEADVPEKHTQ